MLTDYQKRQDRLNEAIDDIKQSLGDLGSGFDHLFRGLEPAQSIANASIVQYREYRATETETDNLLVGLRELVEEFPVPPWAAVDEVLCWLDRAERFPLERRKLPKGYGND